MVSPKELRDRVLGTFFADLWSTVSGISEAMKASADMGYYSMTWLDSALNDEKLETVAQCLTNQGFEVRVIKEDGGPSYLSISWEKSYE